MRVSNPSNLPVVWHGWCDFPYCASDCWNRCDTNNARWDGAPAHLWREVWKVLRRKPVQQELGL